MDKAPIVIIVAVLVLIHVVLYLSLRPVDIERIQTRLERDGLDISSFEAIERPSHNAAEEWIMWVQDDAFVQVFRFDDQDRFEACFNLYRDSRQARQALNRHAGRGIRGDTAGPTVVAQNGWFILTVTSHNEDLRSRIIQLFRSL